MSLKLLMYGQQDSINATPAVLLTGDPGIDQTTLAAAGYFGGRIMAIAGPDLSRPGFAFQPNRDPSLGVLGNIVPCDADAVDNVYGYTVNGMLPYACLMNDPGEFSGTLGPSGSKKAPMTRMMWMGFVDSKAYDTQPGVSWILGGFVYCGGNQNNNIGLHTDFAHAGIPGGINGSMPLPVAFCTHVPTTSEPWLGISHML